MPIQWDNKADAKVTTPRSWAQVSHLDSRHLFENILTKKKGVTVSAVKHRLARIREKAGLPSAREARKAGSSAASSSQPASPVLTTKSPVAGRGRKRDRSDPGRAKRSVSGKAGHKRAGSDGPIHAKRGINSDSAAGRSDSRFDDADEDDEDMKQAEEDEEDAFEG
ncbi:hypothetical protein N7540_003794 [Penicillium herquei]|nr:hypothetical protein N7540_003794 [Penicillium herquei]